MPQAFKDNGGRTWTVDVNVSTVRRVKQLLDVDLMDVVGGDLITKLAGDPILLADVLFAVVKPQADAAGVTSEQFGEGLGGDAIESATNALLEALADFFPGRQRTLIRNALAKGQQVQTLLIERSQQVLDGLDLQKLAGQVLANSGSGSTKPPASSE